MPKGYLVIDVSSAKGRILISQAKITISNKQGFMFHTKTNVMGRSENIALETVSNNGAFDIKDNVLPYVEYDVLVEAEDFVSKRYSNIQIYAEEKSYLAAFLVPTSSDCNEEDMLVNAEVNSVNGQSNTSGAALYNEVIIPTNITVHLGRPNDNARNVTVDFIYYLKNVASSEIYPSWPYECLRANILAIISLALNRVYTSWYKVRGYNFQITNSTQFDQKFIENRNIFDSISKVVDDTFNEYIRYVGNIEPLFASYCDGKTVQCDGMTQWGSYALAKEGYNALEILRHYYGDNIDITTTNNIQDISDPYPGVALKIGDSGVNVFVMQTYLNRIGIDYPNIIKSYPINGIFTLRLATSVKEFQRQFNLEPDGIIGKNTWYKIIYIYLSVKKLAQLDSEGERLPKADLLYPGKVLKEGQKGRSVEILQYFLNMISQFYESIDSVFIDSYFGSGTKNQVVNFQKEFGLKADGMVGQATWDRIVEVFLNVYDIIPSVNELIMYPNIPIKAGMVSDYVAFIQIYLNEIAAFYPTINSVKVDGAFGPSTTKQVKAFQKIFDLKADGVVGRATWDKMLDVYTQIEQIVFYPGAPLALNSQGNYVKAIQVYLNAISAIYDEINPIQVDGFFGPATKKEIEVFQQLFGIPVDGIVGKQTWNKLVEVYLNDVKELSLADDVISSMNYTDQRYSNRFVYNTLDRIGK